MGLIDSNMLVLNQGNKAQGHVVRVLLKPLSLLAFHSFANKIDGCTILADQPFDDAVIGDALVKDADIVLTEVDPRSAEEMTRVADLKARYPDMPIIAGVTDASLESVRALMRLGVADVLEMPLSISALAASIGDIGATLRKSGGPRGQRTGALISIIKSIGGVGATNVAAHLADALAREGAAGRKACLFDLDVQFGNVATYLGLQPQLSLADLLDAGSRIDGDFIRASASTLADGLAVFPAPPQIGPLEAVDQDQLLAVLGAARREYDAIVADMPSNWSNWTLSVVAQSTMILLVVNLSIASLRQGRRQIDLLLSQGISHDRIRVVANRVEKRLFRSISLEDASRALGLPVDYAIPNDYTLVNGANDQGVLVSQANPRSKVAKEFGQMGSAIASLIMAEVN